MQVPYMKVKKNLGGTQLGCMWVKICNGPPPFFFFVAFSTLHSTCLLALCGGPDTAGTGHTYFLASPASSGGFRVVRVGAVLPIV